MKSRWPSWYGGAAVAALAVAFATPVQSSGCNVNAHFALVRSLERGTVVIDRYHWQTCDKSYTDGHFYANKAPGLAFAALPLYAALKLMGLARDPLPSVQDFRAGYDDLRRDIWPLTLWVAAIPAVLLIVLVWRTADSVAPGYGLVTTVALGVSTMLLPFATLLFAHLLAALLGFAAFALVRAEGEGRKNVAFAGAAGLLAGFAITTEYPLALIAAFIGAYMLTQPDRLRRLTAYGVGAAAGVAPLALYNLAAFGSPTHNSYADYVRNQGQTGHDEIGGLPGGFFGIGLPDPAAAAELILSHRGLLVATPVIGAALAGLVPLYRNGHRRDALLVGGLFFAFLLYATGFFTPMGGDTPGPRYLFPTLPFLALPLAAAWRRLPLTTLLLAAVSAVTMIAATLTGPVIGHDDTTVWFERLVGGDFVLTVVGLVGWSAGVLSALPFVGGIGAACALAAAATRFETPWRPEVTTAVIAAVAWAVVASVVPPLVHGDNELSLPLAIALLGAVGTALGIQLRRLATSRRTESVRA